MRYFFLEPIPISSNFTVKCLLGIHKDTPVSCRKSVHTLCRSNSALTDMQHDHKQ